MKKRVEVFVLIWLVVFVTTAAFAAPSPQVWWNRGDIGTTWQEWHFDDGDSPAIVPEQYYNPYGDPTADIYVKDPELVHDPG